MLLSAMYAARCMQEAAASWSESLIHQVKAGRFSAADSRYLRRLMHHCESFGGAEATGDADVCPLWLGQMLVATHASRHRSIFSWRSAGMPVAARACVPWLWTCSSVQGAKISPAHAPQCMGLTSPAVQLAQSSQARPPARCDVQVQPPKHFFYGLILSLRNDKGHSTRSAEEDMLLNPHRVANHIKAMHWLDLGFGPYLGRFFGGELPMNLDALQADGDALQLYPGDAMAALRACRMQPGMGRMLGGKAPVHIRTFHCCDSYTRVRGATDVRLMPDIRDEQALSPTFVQAFAQLGSSLKSSIRTRRCAALLRPHPCAANHAACCCRVRCAHVHVQCLLFKVAHGVIPYAHHV